MSIDFANAAEITNICTCEVFDDEDNVVPADECFGDCWDCAVECWNEAVAPLLEHLNEDSEWHIVGLPLWNRGVSGYVSTDDPAKLLQALTVNGLWHLSYKVDVDALRIDLYISHHDASGSYYVEVVK